MLGLEDFMTIQALVKRGVYFCDIAEQPGAHPRTVRRALQRGGAPARRGGRRGSLLDPYRPLVDQLLGEEVWNTVVIQDRKTSTLNSTPPQTSYAGITGKKTQR